MFCLSWSSAAVPTYQHGPTAIGTWRCNGTMTWHSGLSWPLASSCGRRWPLPCKSLPIRWSAIVGLRNRIVHDYMNIDIGQIVDLVQSGSDQFIVDFLLRPISTL